MNTNSIYKTHEGEQMIMSFYDAVLQRWPIAYQTFSVPTRYGKTFVIASGQTTAPALILLHGSSSNAVSWIGDAAEYSKYFYVLAVDIPGEPGKSDPNRPNWNSPAYAEWMEDILNYLHLEQASFVGLSQGGWTALKFATIFPQRVRKMALLAPAGVIPTKSSFIFKAMLYSLFGKKGMRAINRLVMGNDEVPEEAVRFSETIMTQFKPRMENMMMYSDTELKRLSMPVILLGGVRDPIQNNTRIKERLEKLLPHFKADIYPDKGHVLINLSQTIIPFLRER